LGLKSRNPYKIKTASANKIKIIVVLSSISLLEEIRNTNKKKEGD
jgi:hypothetical protein